MSLLIGALNTALLGAEASILGKVTSKIGGLFGGGGGPNLAKGFSKRAGLSCVVRDDQKAQASALLAKGIDPCTGEAMSVPASSFPSIPSVPDTSTLFPIGTPTRAVNGGPSMSLLPTIIRTGGSLLAGRAVAGVVRTSTGRLSSIVLASGKRFSRRDAAALLRRFGDIAAGAAAMGISQQDAAEIILTSGKRRAKGITAANIRNCRRTTTMISRMARDLCIKPAPVRRKTTCRS